MSTQYLLRRNLSTCHSSYCTETGLYSNYDFRHNTSQIQILEIKSIMGFVLSGMFYHNKLFCIQGLFSQDRIQVH